MWRNIVAGGERGGKGGRWGEGAIVVGPVWVITALGGLRLVKGGRRKWRRWERRRVRRRRRRKRERLEKGEAAIFNSGSHYEMI